MKYKKGQLVAFKKWHGISPSLLMPRIRAFRRNVKVDLTSQNLGVIVDTFPIAKAWHKLAYNQGLKNCYLVFWQGVNIKKLMYEPELTSRL